MIDDTCGSHGVKKRVNNTKNFKSSEFACKCCGLERMSQELVDLLQELRDACGFKLTITSGTRCAAHNAAVGGEANSSHLANPESMGADIAVRDSRHRFVILHNALKMGFNRVGIGQSLIHLDIDNRLPCRVVWLYSNK